MHEPVVKFLGASRECVVIFLLVSRDVDGFRPGDSCGVWDSWDEAHQI